MPRADRGEVFDAREICIVHTIQRCVRQAYLAGKDATSGRDYGPRREWIRRRLEILASVFGVDVLSYAILSNHMHLILRNRPDVVATWTDRQVAERWLKLFPGRRLDEHLGQPTENDIATLQRDKDRLEIIRTRLSDISWFMRSACEPIARLANKQDGVTGRFWEGRFKAQRITDEAGLLACAMYVDLNPVRAAMAETPEQSEHTSAYDRIKSLKGQQLDSAASELVAVSREQAAAEIQSSTPAQRRQKAALRKSGKHVKNHNRPTPHHRIPRDGWLAPLALNERKHTGPQASRSGIRASDKGFLSMPLPDYLTLLDWTGRQGRRDKRGQIPAQLRPILQRLGIEGSMWCELVWNFKRYFGRCAGSPGSLQTTAATQNRHWHRGQRAAKSCFTAT